MGMARPLRIERPGARYHVTARGNERKPLYREDRDRLHFLELLGRLGEAFGVQVHAYVLMDNHYHLLLETPEANLSRAMHWLNVGYSVWFNRRHRRSGHLFQGRFKALVIENAAGWQEVARYVHLNPVRVAGLGLDKKGRARDRQGIGPAPSAELIGERLRLLRHWRWSSYPAYAGYGPTPTWLVREPLAGLCGGRTDRERRAALRQYTEAPVRQGIMGRPWDRLLGGMVLGTQAFARALTRQLRANRREQPALRQLGGAIPWEQIVQAVEEAKGKKWQAFYGQYGDWGRDAALWLGRKRGRLSLRALGELAGAMDYAAVGQAIARLGKRMARDPELRRQLMTLEARLSNVET